MKEQARLYVKFCGMTSIEDVDMAVASGADAIGLVFYPPSKRNLSLDMASVLSRRVPALMTVVALVVNISDKELINITNQVAIDVLQFHGDETAKECARLAGMVKKRWFKALRINALSDTLQSIEGKIDELYHAGACAVLLDAYHEGHFGGTGTCFDWSLIPNNSPLPIILAGGLNSANVSDVVNLPIMGVDVSSGIEVAGRKNAQRICDFMTALAR